MNLSEKKQIQHPDDLVVDNRYSVLIPDNGKLKRMQGRFLHMETHYTQTEDKPRRPHLVILLVRATDTLVIDWKQAKDWREL